MTHINIRTSPFDIKGERKYLDQQERQRFLRSASRMREPIRLFCEVLAYTGCRLSEALNIRPSHIDQGHCALIFETLKQRNAIRYRHIAVPKSLMRRLMRFLKNRSLSNSRVWQVHRQTAWRWIKLVMSNAGITGVSANSRGLRHGFAIASIQRRVPLPLVQKWMGHTRVTTTQIYTDIVGPQQRTYAKRTWEPYQWFEWHMPASLVRFLKRRNSQSYLSA